MLKDKTIDAIWWWKLTWPLVMWVIN